MNLNQRLAGKTVIVTGGGSGLGKGASERIVAEGGSVAVVDIRARLAEEVAADIRAEGGQAVAIACDVSDEAQVSAAVAATVEEFGGIHGLFANADMRIGEIREFCTMSPEARQLLDVAVRQMQLSARAYHRVLKLSRTIADLDNNERIETQHIAEAIQYRPEKNSN